MGGFLKDPPHLVPVTSFLPFWSPCSVLSQLLSCPGEERLNQAMDISPCLLGAAPQFLIEEEG